MVIDEGAGSRGRQPAGILSHVRPPDPETKGLFWGENRVIPAAHDPSKGAACAGTGLAATGKIPLAGAQLTR